MSITALHRALLAFLTVVATAVVVRSFTAPRTTPRAAPAPDALAAIPAGASLLVTADVGAWRGSEIGRALFGATASKTPLGDLQQSCPGDPTRGVRTLAFAIPARALATADAELELGLAAAGDLAVEPLVDCAVTLMQRRGGTPTRTTVGGFVSVRDRNGVSEGELAVRDDGLALLSGGRYLRDMVDAAGGRLASAAGDADHRALRAAIGTDSALIATWVVPVDQPGWQVAVAGVSESDLDHVRAAALAIRLSAAVRLRALVQCDEEAPCRRLAATLEQRLREASGPLTRLWLGFDPTRVRVDAAGKQVTLSLALTVDEARALAERALPALSADGTDRAPQQP